MWARSRRQEKSFMKPAPCKTWLIVIVHVCFREEENGLMKVLTYHASTLFKIVCRWTASFWLIDDARRNATIKAAQIDFKM